MSLFCDFAPIVSTQICSPLVRWADDSLVLFLEPLSGCIQLISLSPVTTRGDTGVATLSRTRILNLPESPLLSFCLNDTRTEIYGVCQSTNSIQTWLLLDKDTTDGPISNGLWLSSHIGASSPLSMHDMCCIFTSGNQPHYRKSFRLRHMDADSSSLSHSLSLFYVLPC